MASNKLTHSPRGVDRGGHAKSSFSLSQRVFLGRFGKFVPFWSHGELASQRSGLLEAA